VSGDVPAALARELIGFTPDDRGPNTVLTGQVVDTAALYGLLARLESLGVVLISVRPIPHHAQEN
jgi:hypothetical protein